MLYCLTDSKFSLNLQARNFTFQVFSPALEITGNYKLSGKLLVFPIEGEGFANITYSKKKNIFFISKKKRFLLALTNTILKIQNIFMLKHFYNKKKVRVISERK